MRFRYLDQRPILTILATAVGLTLMVGMVTYQVMQIYRTIQPIWVEQAAYGQAPMLEFWALINKSGFWQSIPQMVRERHIFQLFVLGILAPWLMKWFHAPLLIVFPIFMVFLWMFGWTIYKRSGRLGYAVTAMLFFCTIAQLTRHNWGIGSGFADWQSMLLLSTAALCLINAFMEPGLGWVRSFSIFISLAVFARTTSVFYATVICGPMLALYFFAQYQRGCSLKLLGTTLLNVLVIIAPGVLTVTSQLANMFAYYSPGNASQLRQPFLISAENIFLRLLGPFLGIPLITALFFLLFINSLNAFSNKPAIEDRIASRNQPFGSFQGFSEIAIGWWILGFLGFLLANGYTSDVPKETMYATPALLLFALTPFSTIGPKNVSFYKYLTVGLVVFSIVCFGWFAYLNIGYAREVNPAQMAFKKAQREIAGELAKLPPEIIWQSYTSIDWGIPVSLITQYEFGEYRQYGGTPFYNKKDYWNTLYPNRSPSELQHEVYAQMINCVDVAVILKDPDKQPNDMEDFSYSIAADIARNVKADTNWSLVESVTGWPDGIKYQIYLNTTPALNRNCQN